MKEAAAGPEGLPEAAALLGTWLARGRGCEVHLDDGRAGILPRSVLVYMEKSYGGSGWRRRMMARPPRSPTAQGRHVPGSRHVPAAASFPPSACSTPAAAGLARGDAVIWTENDSNDSKITVQILSNDSQ